MLFYSFCSFVYYFLAVAKMRVPEKGPDLPSTNIRVLYVTFSL